MFYTNLDKLLDSLSDNQFRTDRNTRTSVSEYYIETTETDKIKLMVNALGHHPNEVDVEANNGQLKIKASKLKNSNPLIKDLNLNFTISREYDESSIEAFIENGLLTVTLHKREEEKSKKIKVKY